MYIYARKYIKKIMLNLHFNFRFCELASFVQRTDSSLLSVINREHIIIYYRKIYKSFQILKYNPLFLVYC